MSRKNIILLFTLLLIILIPPGALAQFKIIINFDDAYSGVYQNAFPLLQKADIPAVVFVPTNYIDSDKHLSLTQLFNLKKAGWEIGSHTVHHPDLTKLTRSGLESEIINSRLFLKGKGLLDDSYASFCSPMTAWNEEIKDIVSNNYQIARADELFFLTDNVQINARLRVVLKTTRIAIINKWIKEAAELEQPLILIFHEVADGGNEYFFPPDKFKELVPILNNYDLVTFQQLYLDYKQLK
jgi:peptidoglycan/xylan/chitin deacetylase (PgdA/CDA1 family)